MKYIKCFLYFFVLAFLSIFKKGKTIRKAEQYLLNSFNKMGFFQLHINSIEYSFPNKFIFDALQVNKNKSFSVELEHFTIQINSPLSIQFNAQQLFIYNNGSIDISLPECNCKISISLTLIGIKLIIRNEVKTLKIFLETIVVRNFIAKTNTISATTSDIAIPQLLSIFQRLSYPLLKNIRFSGTKAFKLQFIYAYDKPMNYTFQLEEKGEKNLEIKNRNLIEFDHLQNDKSQTLIDNSNNIKTFLFNEMNEEFISIHDIPDIVLKTIITTEDPNFLFHNGFDFDCFGFALATNIDAKKFTRGGSTITMQLIRNLYLNHSKTFSRKVEEIILTWIIEDQLHILKDKILEVYVNRIEMGPGVYGIKNAAKYYFEKRVEDLDLLDSLVLSYIIPRPKFFLPALMDQSPTLKKNLKLHINKYASLMKHRQLITNEEYNNLNFTIYFSESLNSLAL